MLLLLKPSSLVLLAVVFWAIYRTVIYWRRRKSCPLPPGPPGEPILGHLRVLPKYGREYWFIRLGKEYASDIISFNVLGKSIIVLNSVKAAVDLLDKRGANYSSRPRLVMFEAMVGENRWASYHGDPNSDYIAGLMENRTDWGLVLRRFAAAIALEIGFGIKIESNTDRFIKIAVDSNNALSNSGAAFGLPVDSFPFLQSMPSWFHDKSLRYAREWKFAVDNLHNEPFKDMTAREKRSSLAQDLLDQRQDQIEKGEEPHISIDDIKGAGAAIFSASSNTTWATMAVFLFSMIMYPEIQAKAQRLVDQVVGRERLPNFEDRPKLQYIDYIIQEALRWFPVAPLGVPHYSLKDDVYRDYFIPGGSIVIANTRAMTQDETVYKNPDEFNPDRYIPVEEGGRGEPLPIGPFGFGRRICVGKHLADANLWIAMTSILSTMKIEKARDGDGNEITPAAELSQGLTCPLEVFPCQIQPRDSQSVDVINQA